MQETIEAVAVGIPESLRQMVEQQVERLSPEDQRMVEAASVVGVEFSAAVVATGLDMEIAAVEERCQRLVQRHQVLRLSGGEEWPDGTVTTRYSLLHALYQQVLYERVPIGRRAWLHQQVGQRLEVAYGAQTDDIAAELAVHFERGREYTRAVRYLERAARRALRRSAPLEAVQHLRTGLRVLGMLLTTPESTQQELALQTALGLALTMIKGHGAQEVEQAYARAHALCHQVGESPRLFPVLFGLWTFHTMRAEFRAAAELCGQLLGLAERVRDPGLLVEAHGTRGVTCLYLGEFAAARRHFEQSLALYDPQQHRSHALLYGQDPGAAAREYLALALWWLGYPDQAVRQSQAAIAYARELSHPFSLAFVLGLAGILHNCRREPQIAYELAAEVMVLANEYGLAHWLAQGVLVRSRALIQQRREKEGVEHTQQVLETWRSEGKALGRPTSLAVLAEAYGAMGQLKQGLNLLAEAVTTVNSSGERQWEAEVYRLKGELTLLQYGGQRAEGGVPSAHYSPPSTQAEAEACFLKAIEVARCQGAKSLELRVVLSLSRLWQQQGKKAAARQLLAEIYDWFTEGFDTADLQEAKSLLEVLT
jgi:predicted ATPase